jgi:hypothetical protein
LIDLTANVAGEHRSIGGTTMLPHLGNRLH